jgi:hypothetical protein
MLIEPLREEKLISISSVSLCVLYNTIKISFTREGA